MKKTKTINLHVQITNDTLYYIYKYIDTDINIDELALEFGISKFHFHKIFKEQMGTNIYETIKSIRLQKASNLLITNEHSTITNIANMCGYSSQTSFIRAFKNRFNCTPKAWRNGEYKEYSNKILKNFKFDLFEQNNYDALEVKIVKTKAMRVYFTKQKGYDGKKVASTWQKMQAWIYTNDIKEHLQIGIFHDNPIVTPHEDCLYMAGISPLDEYDLENTNLQSFVKSPALCASFDVKGKQGEVLKFMQYVYHEWLPRSGFEATTNPPYVVYRKNHALDINEEFDITFYLPIQYI